MEYYIAWALVLMAFLAIVGYVKRGLTQKSASCTCGHDCGACKAARPLTTKPDCSAAFEPTVNERP